MINEVYLKIISIIVGHTVMHTNYNYVRINAFLQPIKVKKKF